MNKKIPFNQEHIEALQAETTSNKDKIISLLSPEDQKKFKVVEDCVKTLVDNKIMFFLYPLLPHIDNENNKTNIVFQYNSLGALAEYDQSGNFTEESKKTLSDYNCALYHNILTEPIRYGICSTISESAQRLFDMAIIWNEELRKKSGDIDNNIDKPENSE